MFPHVPSAVLLHTPGRTLLLHCSIASSGMQRRLQAQSPEEPQMALPSTQPGPANGKWTRGWQPPLSPTCRRVGTPHPDRHLHLTFSAHLMLHGRQHLSCPGPSALCPETRLRVSHSHSKCVLLELSGPTDHRDPERCPQVQSAPRETCISWEGDSAQEGGCKRVRQTALAGQCGLLHEHRGESTVSCAPPEASEPGQDPGRGGGGYMALPTPRGGPSTVCLWSSPAEV